MKTAIEMRAKLNVLNKKWKKEGKPMLDFGVAINTGDMIVGCVGADKILDYTVMGDNVNIAARVEDLNKKYNTSILITQGTYEQVKDMVDTRFVDELQVRGKQEYIKIYEVLGIFAKK